MRLRQHGSARRITTRCLPAAIPAASAVTDDARIASNTRPCPPIQCNCTSPSFLAFSVLSSVQAFKPPVRVSACPCRWVRHLLRLFDHWPRLGAVGLRVGWYFEPDHINNAFYKARRDGGSAGKQVPSGNS